MTREGGRRVQREGTWIRGLKASTCSRLQASSAALCVYPDLNNDSFTEFKLDCVYLACLRTSEGS